MANSEITAFWRAMHNNYDDETYFVYLPEFDQSDDDGLDDDELLVHCVPRWVKKKENRRYPVWADEPTDCLHRGLVPIDLLRPADIPNEIQTWITAATQQQKPKQSDEDLHQRWEKYHATLDHLKSTITTLRERVAHFNLPFLALPATTPKEVALRVFINMNTNSKPLKLYDIAVAEIEQAVNVSLHDLQEDLEDNHPEVPHLGDADAMVLTTGALLQDKMPNNRGIADMDKALFVQTWPTLQRGLMRMSELLKSQGVFDDARLPTNAVLAVIGACYKWVPDHGDFLGRAERLLRAYLWSAFFTDRYENAAATRAFADFKALKTILEKQSFTVADFPSVPILDRVQHPLLTEEQMLGVGWPKSSDRYARAILAVTTYFRALDFADDRPASYDSVQHREYHHVFPDALLRDAGIEESYVALNCALITWKTNRHIGRKDPLEYLEERVEGAGDVETVRARLRTHLLNYEFLSKAHYDGLVGEPLRLKLQTDYNRFRTTRAIRIATALKRLAIGEPASLDEAMNAAVELDGDGQSLGAGINPGLDSPTEG